MAPAPTATLAGLAKAREALGVLVGGEGPIDTADAPTAPAEGRGTEAVGDPTVRINNDPSLAAPPLDEALDEATRSRADVKAAEERLRAARHAERDNWADYAPMLSGIFQPFYQNPPSLIQPLTGWQAEVVLTVPLYDGGLRYGQARERAALSAEARQELEAALRQARSDVRAAFESVRHADDGLAAARSAARTAHEALDLANLAFRAGATTNLEVIDAERRSRDADTQAAVAEDAARQARLDLLAGSGRFP